jgi:chemotaxis receptor (MCP) glutamine deamidase CheD
VWTESPRPERFLEPGEVAFAEAPACLRTLLGSCVAITFWHPQRALGAMCHFLVPLRPASEAGPPNGKYASDAIAVITQRFRTRGLAPEAFEVKLFGGGNMFPDLPLNGFQTIGERKTWKPPGGSCRPPAFGSCGKTWPALASEWSSSISRTEKYGSARDLDFP